MRRVAGAAGDAHRADRAVACARRGFSPRPTDCPTGAMRCVSVGAGRAAPTGRETGGETDSETDSEIDSETGPASPGACARRSPPAARAAATSHYSPIAMPPDGVAKAVDW